MHFIDFVEEKFVPVEFENTQACERTLFSSRSITCCRVRPRPTILMLFTANGTFFTRWNLLWKLSVMASLTGIYYKCNAWKDGTCVLRIRVWLEPDSVVPYWVRCRNDYLKPKGCGTYWYCDIIVHRLPGKRKMDTKLSAYHLASLSIVKVDPMKVVDSRIICQNTLSKPMVPIWGGDSIIALRYCDFWNILPIIKWNS